MRGQRLTAMALAVVTACSTTATTATTAGVPASSSGTVTESGLVLSSGGVTLSVSAGGAPPGTVIAVTAAGVVAADDLLASDPALAAVFADHVLDGGDGLHPLQAALGLGSATAWTVDLEPSGLVPAIPITVTFPPSGGGDSVYLLGSPDGTWEVVAVAGGDGSSTVSVTHFSTLTRIVGNFLSNPLAEADRDEVARIRAGYESGTAGETVKGLIRTAVCREGGPVVDLGVVPEVDELLDYLGWESGSLRTGNEKPIADWLAAEFTKTYDKTTNPRPRTVPFEEVLRRAIEAENGDVFQAMLTVHNVLRDNRDRRPVQDVIADLRGDGGDERGARYHLLGMALYSFVYEHQREQGSLGRLDVSPETAARLEEAWVSGDITSDTGEYVVDIMGANLGRALYAQARSAERSDAVALAGICETEIPLAGSFVLGEGGGDLGELAELVTTNAVYAAVVGDADPRRVDGSFDLTVTIPGSVLYAIGAGIGEAIGGMFGGGSGGETPAMPPELAGCVVTTGFTGTLIGEASGGQASGNATVVVETVHRGCEALYGDGVDGLTIDPPEPPRSIPATWQATFDGFAMTGTLSYSDPEPMSMAFQLAATAP